MLKNKYNRGVGIRLSYDALQELFAHKKQVLKILQMQMWGFWEQTKNENDFMTLKFLFFSKMKCVTPYKYIFELIIDKLSSAKIGSNQISFALYLFFGLMMDLVWLVLGLYFSCWVVYYFLSWPPKEASSVNPHLSHTHTHTHTHSNRNL